MAGGSRECDTESSRWVPFECCPGSFREIWTREPLTRIGAMSFVSRPVFVDVYRKGCSVMLKLEPQQEYVMDYLR